MLQTQLIPHGVNFSHSHVSFPELLSTAFYLSDSTMFKTELIFLFSIALHEFCLCLKNGEFTRFRDLQSYIERCLYAIHQSASPCPSPQVEISLGVQGERQLKSSSRSRQSHHARRVQRSHALRLLPPWRARRR